jgi:hypothetical protein
MNGRRISQKRERELLEGLTAKGFSDPVAADLMNCIDLMTNVDDLLSVIELGFLPAKSIAVGAYHVAGSYV